MNQTASQSLKNTAVTATIYMVLAQAIFAIVNFVYDALTNPWNPMLEGEKLSSSSAVFWQYLIAALFALPLVFRIGLNKLKTKHPLWHEIRALASAIGAQVFVFGFASGVPVWQMVGLLLTGPFFVLIGSVLFLGEHLSPTTHRYINCCLLWRVFNRWVWQRKLYPCFLITCFGRRFVECHHAYFQIFIKRRIAGNAHPLFGASDQCEPRHNRHYSRRIGVFLAPGQSSLNTFARL